MKRYAIHMGEKTDESPVGYLEFTDEISDNIIQHGTIVPLIRPKIPAGTYETVCFSFVLTPAIPT